MASFNKHDLHHVTVTTFFHEVVIKSFLELCEFTFVHGDQDVVQNLIQNHSSKTFVYIGLEF